MKTAIIKKHRFIESGTALDVYYDKATIDFTGVALSLVGFPDFPGKNDWVQVLADYGYMVFQPHYEGTYDSAGSFSPIGCRNTISTIMTGIRNDVWSDKLPTPSRALLERNFTVAAHSFGPMIVIRNFDLLEQVDHLYLTGALLHCAPQYGCIDDIPATIDYVSRSFPFTYRISDPDAWTELFNGNDSLPEAPLGKARHVRILYGSQDKYFTPGTAVEVSPGLVSRYIESEDLHASLVPGGDHSSASLIPYIDITR